MTKSRSASWPLPTRNSGVFSCQKKVCIGVATILEKEGVHLILIEEVKEDREGLAIMNRVRKAAGDSVWVSLPPDDQ